ncbi:MAG TPA: SUF system Fe-S cluster assembly regulator [Nevskiaceae bacterium]|nr:SUF system Fe-S cluster assembly regulator [Nevskiaceae bacterium]
MIRLGKLTDYGTVLLTVMAGEAERVYTASELAERSRIAAPTVAKLLKQLTRGGLVASARGAHGGYRLAREPARINVAEVVEVLEGPIALTECAPQGGGCDLSRRCGARGNFRLIDQAIRQALQAVTLADMHQPPARAREWPLHLQPRSRGV